jgi:hypothetical protein
MLVRLLSVEVLPHPIDELVPDLDNEYTSINVRFSSLRQEVAPPLHCHDGIRVVLPDVYGLELNSLEGREDSVAKVLDDVRAADSVRAEVRSRGGVPRLGAKERLEAITVHTAVAIHHSFYQRHLVCHVLFFPEPFLLAKHLPES